MKLKIGLAVLAAVAACGGASQTALAKARPGYDQQQCFYTRNVTSFAAPDDKTLYVRVGVRDVYRFDMFAPCLDMDWNQRLALVSRGSSWICEGMDAEVISHAAGLGRQRCPVTHVHKLTPEEVAALPRRARP